MMHIPAAHTDRDTLVYFRRSDVISAGDLFLTTGYPVIDLERGGSLQGVIAGLNRILEYSSTSNSSHNLPWLPSFATASRL